MLRPHLSGAARADVIGDAGPLRPLAGHDAGARRRADRTGGVGVGESRAVPGQAVQVRRLVEGAAVASEVALPQVVGEKEQHVGAFRDRLTQQVLGNPLRSLPKLAALEDLLDTFQRHLARRPHKVQRIQGGQDFVLHGTIEHRRERVQGRIAFAQVTQCLGGSHTHIAPIVFQQRRQLCFGPGRLVLEHQTADRAPIADDRMRVIHGGHQVRQDSRIARRCFVGERHDPFDRVRVALGVIVDRLVAGQTFEHAFGNEARVARGNHLGTQLAAHLGQPFGVAGIAGQVLDLERIGGDVIEFLGWFRFPIAGLDRIALACHERRMPRTHAREHLERIRVMLSPGPVRAVVADVAELRIPNSSHGVVTLVHASAVQEHVFPRCGLLIAQERAALIVLGNRHAAQAQQRGREIHEADQLVAPLAGLSRSETRPFLREADDQRHVRPRVVQIPFASRQRAAVVGVIEDDRVLGQPRFFQFGQQRAHLLVQPRHLVVVVGPIQADLRRVRMIRRQDDLLRRHAVRTGILSRLGCDLALVTGRQIEDREERLARTPILVVSPGAALVPRLARVRHVIVGLRVVRAVIARLAEGHRVQRERVGDRHSAAVMLRAQRTGIHPGDQRGACGRADRRVGKRVPVANALRGQAVQVGRLGQRIAVTAQIRAVVLAGDPQDVGTIRRVRRNRGRSVSSAAVDQKAAQTDMPGWLESFSCGTQCDSREDASGCLPGDQGNHVVERDRMGLSSLPAVLRKRSGCS